ncbi:hypothetical protein ACS0TY_008661 [Phlomoides rotata]
MGDATIENARTIKRIIRNLELLSGLKVNFVKCSVSGINVEGDRLAEISGILGCNVASIPFSYLGIKVGINHRCIAEWDVIVQKIKNRLKRWGDKKFSIGGRITLLTSGDREGCHYGGEMFLE